MNRHVIAVIGAIIDCTDEDPSLNTEEHYLFLDQICNISQRFHEDKEDKTRIIQIYLANRMSIFCVGEEADNFMVKFRNTMEGKQFDLTDTTDKEGKEGDHE